MAYLVKCSLCGRDVSSETHSCPGCGHDVAGELHQKAQQKEIQMKAQLKEKWVKDRLCHKCGNDKFERRELYGGLLVFLKCIKCGWEIVRDKDKSGCHDQQVYCYGDHGSANCCFTIDEYWDFYNRSSLK